MGVELMCLAALFVAVSNLCMRRSIDNGGTTKGFLMIQLTIIFLVAVLLNPIRTGDFHWSPKMALFGFSSGLVLAGMFVCLGRALEKGPPGLTFAILNTSTVMPILLMVMLFGASFGFLYTRWNGVGSALVVAGLFWAGWQTLKAGNKSQWLAYAFGAFALHVVFLVVMQWRALYLNFPGSSLLSLSFSEADASSQWFMPMAFLAASIVQIAIYLQSEKRLPTKGEISYGLVGGISNGVGTFFMIRSTEVATSLEQAMIFPILSVGVILLCNLWGRVIYKEQINWRANALCVGGVLLGTVDWSMLFS